MKFISLAVTIALPLVAGAGAQSVSEKMERGLAFLESGDREAARALFLETVRENPRHGPARLLLGQMALEEGLWKEAEEHLQVAATSNPRRIFLAWHLLGRVYLLKGDYREAHQAFNRSLEKAPEFAPALLGRARAGLFLGQLEKGSSDLEIAAKLPETAAEASLLAGELQILLNRLEEARPRLQTLLSNESSESLRHAASVLLQSLEAAPETEVRLMTALGQNLTLAEGYLALGIFYVRKGEKDKARLPLQIALETDDQNPLPALFLQMVAAEEKRVLAGAPYPDLARDFSRARESFNRADYAKSSQAARAILERRPFYAPAHLLLLEVAERQGDLWEALAICRRILEWLPGLPALQVRLARLARSMGAYGLAECSLRQALAALPEEGSLHHLLAAIQSAAGRIDEALNSCQQAVALGFQEAPVYLTLGDLYYQKLAISESIAALGKALERDPRAAETIASFALSALTTEDYAALRVLLEKHVQAHPDNLNSLYSLGVMHLRESQLERAKEYFLRLERLAPRHAQVQYNLSLIYLREGRNEEARAAMARFEQLKAEERQQWLKHNQAHAVRLEARDALSAGEIEKAIGLYERLAQEGTAELSDLLAVGNACLDAGKKSEAFSWLQRAISLAPYDPLALEAMARAAEGLLLSEVAEGYRERLKLLANPCAAQ